MKLKELTRTHVVEVKTQTEYDSVNGIFSKVSTGIWLSGFAKNNIMVIGFLDESQTEFTDGTFTEYDADFIFIPASDLIATNQPLTGESRKRDKMKDINKFKAGKYYIGDLCYIFGDSWSDISGKGCEEPFLYDKKKVLIGSTAYGDGAYKDNAGREYFVDSGTLGIAPVSLLKKDGKHTEKSVIASEGMHIVKFDKDFNVSVWNGVFEFGDLRIDTENEEDDEDEDDGYCSCCGRSH